MTAAPHIGSIDATVLRVVCAKAAGLAGAYGFNHTDREDIRQELLLDCLVRFAKFDPAKSSHITFLHRIVGHRIATLLAAQRAACRDYRLHRASLDAPVQFEGVSLELGETISADDFEARIGQRVLSPVERTELQIDVSSVISLLPAELAPVAVLLQWVSVVEAGRRLGLSRSTLHRRLTRIREVFAAAGLDEYLGQTRSKRRSEPARCRDCASPIDPNRKDTRRAVHPNSSRLQNRASSLMAVKRRLQMNSSTTKEEPVHA